MEERMHRTALPILGILVVATGFTIYLFAAFIQSLPSYHSYGTPGAASADLLVTKGTPSERRVTQPEQNASDPVYGPANATVTIFEFSDFSCPYCHDMAGTLKDAVDRHPGVKLVWKDFPLTAVHANAMAAHTAARCAAVQGKFWPYHDRLFATQDTLSDATYHALATAVGLNVGTFSSCLTSPSTKAFITKNIAEGNALEISGTPELFVGDQRIPGAASSEELDQVIAFELELAQRPK